jgi:FAD/FMN-containing dehydrogenase
VPPTTTTSTTVPPTPARAADWDALSAQLTGRLSRPGARSYAVDRELYDPVFDSIRPAGVAFCSSAADVARCVAFARDHGLPLAARSGGHSYAGYSTTTGLVIDVSLMDHVNVASSGEIATVGPGARLIDVYSGLVAHGVSIPAGSCPTVGIAGLSLGGGIGVMDRLHGVTCDHIVGLEVVTAAGEVVQADAGTNADLYWACRGGGGGNFGIVTQFRFSTFAVADVSLFGLSWPWAAAADLLPAWMEWASEGPDELWSNCLFEANGEETPPLIQVGGVWAGSQADAQAQLAKLFSVVGPPSSQDIGENGFEDAMYIEGGCRDLSQSACHLAGKYPGGTLPRAVTVAKSDIINQPFTPAGVQTVLAGINERQDRGQAGSVVFDSWGGAINRVAPSATAFVHRRARASAQYIVEFPAGVAKSSVKDARSWLDGWYASLRPYVSGEAYQNYIDPGLADWEQAYYGANLPRLKRVKAKWDPDDVFHFAQSIPLPRR